MLGILVCLVCFGQAQAGSHAVVPIGDVDRIQCGQRRLQTTGRIAYHSPQGVSNPISR